MKALLSYNPDNYQLVLRVPHALALSSLVATIKVTIGFTDIGDNRYLLETSRFSRSELFSIIRDIVDLLVSENIAYSTDINVDQLMRQANNELKSRKTVDLAAKELLKRKVLSANTLISAEFKRPLKKYQWEPVRLLVNIPYAANFSVPGSGKTSMLYAAFSRLKATGNIRKLFIIAPGPAYLAWAEEYEKCFNRKPRIARLTGPRHRRYKIYHEAGKHEIFITTFHTASSDVNEISNLLMGDRFMLVLDESHNIKRFIGGAWSSAVKKIATHAERRVILTGTPVPNSLLDLWSQFYFLDPEIVGAKAQFINIINREDAIERLRERLSPYYRRVKKAELKLPNPMFRSIIVRPSKLQRKIYESIKLASLDEINYSKTDKMLLKYLRKSVLIRLMQAASNPTLLYERSEEFDLESISKDRLSRRIEPSVIEGIRKYSRYELPVKLVACDKLARHLLKTGKKIVIWSVWIKNLLIMEKQLKEYNPVIIYGDVPINEESDPIDNRELRIKRFKTDPSCRILIGNPGACGESISLHDVCHDAIYVDRTFNAGQYMQSLDRIHRVGLSLSSKTNYYLIQVEDSIDETIGRRLEEKRARMARVLNEDFQILNLETNLGEVSDVAEDLQDDYDETLKDLIK